MTASFIVRFPTTEALYDEAFATRGTVEVDDATNELVLVVDADMEWRAPLGVDR